MRIVVLDTGPLGLVMNPKATVAGITHLPLTTATMVRAAELWATARQEDRPTAGAKELDRDVTLSAQAEAVENPGDEVVVATTNVGHLGRFVNAARWQDIPSSR